MAMMAPTMAALSELDSRSRTKERSIFNVSIGSRLRYDRDE
jgi:hypothetical protein